MGLNQGYTATVYLLQENVGFPNECSVRSSEKFLVLPTYTMFCGKKKKKKETLQMGGRNIICCKNERGSKQKLLLLSKSYTKVNPSPPPVFQQSEAICESQFDGHIQAGV